MNLPNKLTLLRIIMIPVFVVLLYLDFPFNNLVALAVFILASITDTLDGYIARKYNLITDFGKFMDPIADKLLVTAAMLVFVDWHMMPAWVVIVVVALGVHCLRPAAGGGQQRPRHCRRLVW